MADALPSPAPTPGAQNSGSFFGLRLPDLPPLAPPLPRLPPGPSIALPVLDWTPLDSNPLDDIRAAIDASCPPARFKKLAIGQFPEDRRPSAEQLATLGVRVEQRHLDEMRALKKFIEPALVLTLEEILIRAGHPMSVEELGIVLEDDVGIRVQADRLREALALVSKVEIDEGADAARTNVFGERTPAQQKSEAKGLLRMLLEWRVREPRSSAVTEAFAIVGRALEEEAHPLHRVTVERGSIVSDEVVDPLDQIKARVTVHTPGSNVVRLVRMERGERAPCVAGHPDSEACSLCIGEQIAGEGAEPIEQAALLYHERDGSDPTRLAPVPQAVIDAARATAPRLAALFDTSDGWTPKLAGAIARELMRETATAPNPKRAHLCFLGIAEGLEMSIASSPEVFAETCQDVLGYIPAAVLPFLPIEPVPSVRLHGSVDLSGEWTTDLGRRMAQEIADAVDFYTTSTAVEQDAARRALLHVARGRLQQPAWTALDLAIFCQRLLGLIPAPVAQAVIRTLRSELVRWDQSSKSWRIAIGLPTAQHHVPYGTQKTACGIFVRDVVEGPRGATGRAGTSESVLYVTATQETTCPDCADAWTRS